MLYVQLDTNWPDNHKIIDAGVDGAGAHAIILCLAKRLEADGWVRRTVLRRYGIDADLIDRLVLLELLEADEHQVRPWDWHSRNPSQAAIDAKRASKADAGRRGNHTKHHHGGAYEDCEKCQVIAGCDRTASQPLAGDIHSDRSSRTPTSRGIAEVEPAIAPANGAPPHPDSPAGQLAARAAAYATSQHQEPAP